ncbi:SDR family oxidoreductase [Rhizobium sp. Leaf341]|uniref:SDR family oxidoreductase n=1 Tax=Rhizobium sp. Leaf341 TaxID=1736344 RepID=UPI0007129441|nr:SDR family oxidoreductase [Rhizobium sp. Leaf341]KQR69183.1 C factor [Rhizobium sp. Leaf341]
MRGFEAGYRAVVLGASGGIGSAVLSALDADPKCSAAVGLSRRDDGMDVTDEASVAAAARRIGDAMGTVDLVFDATGALEIDGHGPEKTIRAIDPAVMARQFAVNAIGPALLIKHFAPLLPRDRRCLFATLSARVGSIGDNRLGGWISYRSAKAALNQIVRTAAIEIARTAPQSVVVALHPGTVDTGLTSTHGKHADKMSPAEAAAALLAVLSDLSPAQTGQFLAYDGTAILW